MAPKGSQKAVHKTRPGGDPCPQAAPRAIFIDFGALLGGKKQPFGTPLGDKLCDFGTSKSVHNALADQNPKIDVKKC